MKYDIDIDGQGFYTIHARTVRATKWMFANIYEVSHDRTFHRDMAGYAHVYSDDTQLTQDITDAAFEAGLNVRVNGKRYLGENRVAA